MGKKQARFVWGEQPLIRKGGESLRYPENVIRIAEIMAKYGYRAYAVGGCVRDSIMGRAPSDWDMTTDAPPDKMIEIFEREGVRTIPTGLKHGTVTVLIDGEGFELTTFRIDGSYTDSRHPDAVTFTKNIEKDLARRDFTVNAMAADPLWQKRDRKADGTCAADDRNVEKQEIIDVFGGIEDIKNKVIRAVGEPEKRFQEDALRILRAVRFAATLGFDIDEDTKKAADKMSDGLYKVAIERKKVELEKMLVSDGADRGIELLFELELEKYIHLELKKPKRSLLTLPKRFETRMSALFFGGGGAPESVPDLSDLKLSRAESANIKKLCDKSKFCSELSEKNARRMIFEYGDLAYDAAMLNKNNELAELIKKEAIKSPCVSVAQLDIKGNDLISAGIEPKSIGEIMAYLLDRVIDEPSLNKKEILLTLLIENHRI